MPGDAGAAAVRETPARPSPGKRSEPDGRGDVAVMSRRADAGSARPAAIRETPACPSPGNRSEPNGPR